MTYKFGTNYGRIGTARSANLQAYYKFDGDLTDSSGNGFTLSVNTGTELYCRLPNQNYQAFKFDGSTRLEKSAETEFVITGAFSMHVLICPDSIETRTLSSGYDDWLIQYGDNITDSGNSPETNYLYNLSIRSSKFASFIEYGAGSNSEWDTGTYSPAAGQPVFVTQTRDASGNYALYVNGSAVTVNGVTSYPNAPTGGDDVTCLLSIGGQDSNSNRFYPGAMAELQILNIELSASQVLEDATKVMPWL